MIHTARHTAARGFVHFVDSAHIEGLASVGVDLFHEVTITVIDKLCGLSADCNRDQTVLSVEGVALSLSKCLGISQSTFYARDHTCTCARCKCISIRFIGLDRESAFPVAKAVDR